MWIAASTHEGEELVVLKAHAEVLRRFPDALLLIAPRHPERFKALATACKAFGFRTATRSEDGSADRTQAMLRDRFDGRAARASTRRPMSRSSAAAWSPVGGHNLLEPAALARPVIVGPHTFNFAEVTEDLIKAGAVLRIPDADALGPAVVRLLSRDIERRTMGEAAHA